MRAVLSLGARGPFRLAAVAVSHGWFQTAPFAWDPARQVLRRVEDLDGPVVVTLTDSGSGADGAPDRALAPAARERLVGRLTRALQLDADLVGFEAAAAAVDPRLARDLAAYGGGRVLAGGSLFEDVVKGICGTNTTWTQAVATINRIGALGPGGAFPKPEAVIAAGEDRLRTEARVGYRAGAIVAAATAALDGRLDAIEADSAAWDGDRTMAGLQGLAGVGPATAAFIILLMGHYDRPSVDSATIRVATDAWFGGTRPTPREVLDRIAPAEGFRGLVLAWATLRSWQRTTGLVPG